MPRRRYTVQAPLDRETRERLESGHCFFGDEVTDAELHRLWVAHRPALLAEWILEKPATRPWAWWMWDAPKAERLRIGGTGTELREHPAGKHPLSFGTPNAFADDYRNDDAPRFEPERAYLSRHGLLTKAER